AGGPTAPPPRRRAPSGPLRRPTPARRVLADVGREAVGLGDEASPQVRELGQRPGARVEARDRGEGQPPVVEAPENEEQHVERARGEQGVGEEGEDRGTDRGAAETLAEPPPRPEDRGRDRGPE